MKRKQLNISKKFRQPFKKLKPHTAVRLMRRLTLIGLALFVAFTLWQYFGPGASLQTALLGSQGSGRSVSRLNSALFEFVIETPGKLTVKSLSNSAVPDASIIGILIQSQQASFGNWQLSSALNEIINQVNPQNAQEIQLIAGFPVGHFASTDKVLAELPFQTGLEGQFDISNIFLGNQPVNTFPGFQSYPIFIDSFQSIAFDENGAALVTTPAVPPPPSAPPPAMINPFVTTAPEEEVLDPFLLDLPADVLKSADFVQLPPAQEGLQYLYKLQAKGGQGLYRFGLFGRTADQNKSFPMGESGLRLKEFGDVVGSPGQLKAGNYRFQAFVRDNFEVKLFTLQIAVHDASGNPVGILLNTSPPGNTQECQLDELCVRIFSAVNGIAPYTYTFSGESPVTGSFLQIKRDAFYRYIPTEVGTFTFTITAIDSTQQSASQDFTLEIVTAPIETSFKFSPGVSCEFLDLSLSDPYYEAFQFTCRNAVMRGFEGLIRAQDSLNRAEAAKITSLIVADQATVDANFAPFVGVSAGTQVNYQDVTVGDWYAGYVYYLFRENIIIDNVVYRPADTLNCAEALKLVFESYGELNNQVFTDLDNTPPSTDWFGAYKTMAQYLNAQIGFVDPALPAKRAWIADLLYRLYLIYPVGKFQ